MLSAGGRHDAARRIRAHHRPPSRGARGVVETEHGRLLKCLADTNATSTYVSSVRSEKFFEGRASPEPATSFGERVLANRQSARCLAIDCPNLSQPPDPTHDSACLPHRPDRTQFQHDDGNRSARFPECLCCRASRNQLHLSFLSDVHGACHAGGTGGNGLRQPSLRRRTGGRANRCRAAGLPCRDHGNGAGEAEGIALVDYRYFSVTDNREVGRIPARG